MEPAKDYRLIDQADVKGKRVLVRVDFNVPLDNAGDITNDKRIRDALQTIRFLLDNHAKIILMSHLGRPEGSDEDGRRYLTMDAVGLRLGELLGIPIRKVDDCVGIRASEAVKGLGEGEVLLLENLRFHPEEKKDDGGFANNLASLADIYCNEAFSVCHRKHASVHAITDFLPSYAGFLLDKEVRTITKAMDDPARPLVAIVGGIKLETKIPMIEHLLKVADQVIIGGAMVFTFLKSQGREVGDSIVDDDSIGFAKGLLDRHGEKLLLPVDVAIADELSQGKARQEVGTDSIPVGMIGLDIGKVSVERMEASLKEAKTVIWNGPLGAFETDPFGFATEAVAKFLAGLHSVRIIGGGDTAAAIEKAGVEDKMTHVSTGGGASLSLFSGEKLVAVERLKARP